MNNLGIIILAAGKGKRMGGAKPKVLFELNGKPLIDYVIATARSLNPSRIVIVVGFGKEQVIEHLSRSDGFLKNHPGEITDTLPTSEQIKFGKPVPLYYVVQEQLLGTGNAVQQAEPLFSNFNGTIAIFNGDVPLISIKTVQDLLNHHLTTDATVTILTASYSNPFGYGRIIHNSKGEPERIVEENDATPEERAITEVNTGTYVFRSDALFPHLHLIQRNNTQGEYYLTDIIEILRTRGFRISALKTSTPEETYGINTSEQLQKLNELAYTVSRL
jgi:bifunctional UDP-N-acetylglucosamine pyrophosphorylase/glucosamine-1-phosphate N-acetyltransferase